MNYIIFILIGVIFIQCVLHYFERRKLYSLIRDNKKELFTDDKPCEFKKHHVTAHKRKLNEWRDKKPGDVNGNHV